MELFQGADDGPSSVACIIGACLVIIVIEKHYGQGNEQFGRCGMCMANIRFTVIWEVGFVCP